MTEYPEYNPLDEMEEEDNDILESKLDIANQLLKITNERLNYKIYQLKKLAEFQQLESWGMSLSHEQQKEKLEILNMYL
jgi:hypothetical protein